jgi:hypothetical protein
MKAFVERENLDTPFRDPAGIAYLESRGIHLTPSILAADVVVTFSVARARQLRLRFPWKRFVAWTNEPHYDYTPPDAKPFRILVRNVFSGRVFLHNRHFLQTYYARYDPEWWPNAASRAPRLDAAGFSFATRAGNRNPAFIFTRRPERDVSLVIAGGDVNLEPLRLRLAEEFHARGRGHIYGGSWPPGVAIDDFRGDPTWWKRKVGLLGSYNFVAAIENAAFPYYCTEKIWHAIMAGCLPIYWGRGTAIHETFPKGSFVDVADFRGTTELIEHLDAMSEREFCDRFNMCAEVFEREQALRRQELDGEERVEFRELVADLRAWVR